MSMNLCATFQERAEWTDRIIAAGYSSRLGILEETITDIHLLEFARRHPLNVWTKKFTRKEEGSLSGADWLWCIGGADGWLPMAIQAKLIDPTHGTCRYLDYRHGEQRRNLVRFARRFRLVPLYCIYSHLDGTFDPVSIRVPRRWKLARSQWACAFVTPRDVQRLVTQDKRKQQDVLAVAIPWMLPFRDIKRRTRGLAKAVARQLRSATDRAQSAFGSSLLPVQTQGDGGIQRAQWSEPNPMGLVVDQFPVPVARLLAGDKWLKGLVSGVSVISDSPVAEALHQADALPDGRKKLKTFKRILSVPY